MDGGGRRRDLQHIGDASPVQMVEIPADDLLLVPDQGLLKTAAARLLLDPFQQPPQRTTVVFHAQRPDPRELGQTRQDRFLAQVVCRNPRRGLVEVASRDPCRERVDDPREGPGRHGEGRDAAPVAQQRQGESSGS